jgi:hypothetical protein
MRLRRLGLVAALCAATALSSVAAATSSQALNAPGSSSLAAAPFAVGTGNYPVVVATPTGGILVYHYATPGFTLGPNSIAVCTLAAGVRHCTHSTTLTYPFGSGVVADNPAAVFVSGSTVKVATAGDSVTGDPGNSNRVVVWTSTDGGVTFGAPTNLGLTSTNYGGATFNLDGSTLYTWTSGCACGTAVNALPTDGSAAASTTYLNIITAADQLGTVRGEIQVLPDGGLLLTAGNFTPTIDAFWLHAGGNPVDPAQWSKVVTVPNADYVALGGTGLVSGPGSGPAHVFLLTVSHTTGAIGVQRWTGAGFVAAGSIKRGRYDVSGAADAKGRLHVFYEPVAGFDQAVTSVGIGSYGVPSTVVTAKAAAFVSQSSASVVGSGGGWFAFSDQGASSALKVVPLLQAHVFSGPKVVRNKKTHAAVVSGRVTTGRAGLTVTLNAVTRGRVGAVVARVKLGAGLTFSFPVKATLHGAFAVVAPASGFSTITASKVVGL